MHHRDLASIFVVALSSATTLSACSGGSILGSGPSGCESIPAEETTVSVAAFEADLSDAGYFGSTAPVVGQYYSSCETVCPDQRYHCEVKAIDGGEVDVSCNVDCTGRRPAGYRPPPRRGPGAGDHFARMATLEGASVTAFRGLARELAEHRAPRSLVHGCRRAARDEIRHTRSTQALARAHGARSSPACLAPPSSRSLEALALENAVEGCVRETFGALVACWQAREAADPVVRAAMARIAHDETRHAALSWSIDAWARSRLSRDARARVDGARDEAVRSLIGRSTRGRQVPYARALGLPSRAQEMALASSLRRTLFDAQ